MLLWCGGGELWRGKALWRGWRWRKKKNRRVNETWFLTQWWWKIHIGPDHSGWNLKMGLVTAQIVWCKPAVLFFWKTLQVRAKKTNKLKCLNQTVGSNCGSARVTNWCNSNIRIGSRERFSINWVGIDLVVVVVATAEFKQIVWAGRFFESSCAQVCSDSAEVIRTQQLNQLYIIKFQVMANHMPWKQPLSGPKVAKCKPRDLCVGGLWTNMATCFLLCFAITLNVITGVSEVRKKNY